MYFSRLTLKPGRYYMNQYMIDFGNIYNEHRKVWKFFPQDAGAKRDFLYRRNDKIDLPQYYILSGREPVNEQGIWTIETKEFMPVIRKGDCYSFSLRVNPVVTKKMDSNDSKKRRRDDIYMEALARYDEISPELRPTNNEILVESGIKWITEKASAYGFLVKENEAIVEGYRHIEGIKGKGDHNIQLGVIDYSGLLHVADEELFVSKALKQGIGKAKAFGCGLLLIKKR